ncbi:hypothetical protein Pla123a_31590 [Posidoniimonas polymericola]|uniref:PEP-CTERM protein-sorting domain-containing protein n=1 Tax=Posidoniimonas polymericola TaxID=2528002 RepID=A0A5C5YLG9_9BACT|nr:hypothetical protein [Posidoniimonas polymericola]TWT75649.1 hypothetical protein Pla123a_31590 [Posidoniimonas polymericola]
MKKLKTLAIIATLAANLACGSAKAVVWNGPSTTFSKAPFADSSLPENQDRLTDDIWITRTNTRGLYNAVSEIFQGDDSPAGTQWAVGTTTDLGSLSFDTWLNTVGLSSSIGGPPNSVGVDFVVHLVSDDIYFDLQFTEWGQGSGAGGSFAYIRSTPLTANGDFNSDGLVDAADYTIWRDTLDSTEDLRADANGDNVINTADYDIWAATYDSPIGAATSTPEPSTAATLVLACVAAGLARTTNRRSA